jgi:hypothetical protein
MSQVHRSGHALVAACGLAARAKNHRITTAAVCDHTAVVAPAKLTPGGAICKSKSTTNAIETRPIEVQPAFGLTAAQVAR